MDYRTSLFDNALIWFGAAASIAEILAGMCIAPLGLENGVLAIILGHIIGCSILFLAGYISARTGRSAMESVSGVFGSYGGKFFAILNLIQLIGWTSIMIYDGSLAANTIVGIGAWIWAAVIGALIIIWVVSGFRNVSRLNTVTIILLSLIIVAMFRCLFFDQMGPVPSHDVMTFGAAVELSVAMPLSWVPLIGDYTSKARKPAKASLVSVVAYGVMSAVMYVVGLAATYFTGSMDLAEVMLILGFGTVGVLAILISTVTTTFMDAYSSGETVNSIKSGYDSRYIGAAVTVIGVILAILFPMDDISDFLYFIGSVFAPMIAVCIANVLILKKDGPVCRVDVVSMAIWFTGFIIYRILMTIDIPVGNSLIDVVITVAICLVVSKLTGSSGRAVKV